MKKSCLYFDKKNKCASFIVHYKRLTLNKINKFSTLYFISVVNHISAILPITCISNYYMNYK